MRGTNELILNHDTVVEALQEYFDSRYSPTFQVRSVELSPTYDSTTKFKVIIEKTEAKELNVTS